MKERHHILLVVAFALAVISIIILILVYNIRNTRGEDNIPGPDFHDGTWEQGPTQENWISMYLTLVGYMKKGVNGLEMGMEVYYNSELVMQAWGAMFKNHKLEVENAHYAIKQEDGNWRIGNVGQEWWEIIEEENKVWFFVTTESGLKEGRGFPTGILGESPEDLPEMEIDPAL